MQIKTTGRAALILALSLFALSASTAAKAICLLDCPPAEQASDKAGAARDGARSEAKAALKKYSRRHYRRSRHAARRRHLADAARPERPKAAEIRLAEDRKGAESGDIKVPAAVANANAKLLGDAQTAPARSDLRDSAPRDGLVQLVAAEEFNDIDRAAGQPDMLPAKMSAALADSRAQMRADESGGWDNTSVIGRIFIGLGMLLTLFSAARMFWA